MFSPYYAFARRKTGRADPDNHIAVNVVLYGAAGKRWAMTERGRADLARDQSTLGIGKSRLTFDGTRLVIDVDEVTSPWPSRIRGRITVHPSAIGSVHYPLDSAGRHHWRPITPVARIEVALEKPGLSWSGSGYCDFNQGDEPLERGFTTWDWSRSSVPGETTVYYDVNRRDGTKHSLSLALDAAGGVRAVEPPPRHRLPGTGWRIGRGTRSVSAPAVADTLEDTPFYTRSLVKLETAAGPTVAMHESLSLDRFASNWVQILLPFRMPRRTRA